MNRILGVIPARIGSERLARKPLQLLGGRPLIEVVWRRVASFNAVDKLIVATDSYEVEEVCRAAGADVELTSALHRSGTERVAEVVQKHSDFGVIVNIQGDEPFVTKEHIHLSAQLVRNGWDVGTPAAPVQTLQAWRDPSVVKIARGADGRALYFSRAAIPFKRDGDPTREELASEKYLRHIGVYAYARAVLLEWVQLPETELERQEKLEQLRALAAGMRIGVAIAREAAAGIDTREDLIAAEKQLAQLRRY